MRIIQVCNHLYVGDGVSNCILSVQKILDEIGVENLIFVKFTNASCKGHDVHLFEKVEEIDAYLDDVIFYHFHGGGELNGEIERLQNKKVLIYQNITPPHFFYRVDPLSVLNCVEGLAYAQRTRDYYLRALVMSSYNLEDLIRIGWNDKNIKKIPLLDDSNTVEVEGQLDWWDNQCINILFVGRIAPNKKIEDLIDFISYYENNIDSNCRLILVGGTPYNNYYRSLLRYIKSIHCNSVIFRNHVSDTELNLCYQKADVFLCMSEHEGFCMPIIEAMQRKLPVIAYASSAVKETVGQAGVLFEKKDNKMIAEVIKEIMNDREQRDDIINRQLQHANKMTLSKYKGEVIELIKEIEEIEDYSYKKNVFRMNLSNDTIETNDEIIIYGAGNAGRKLYEDIKDELHVVGFCDNGKVGNSICGIPVYQHEECVKKYRDATYIISIQNSPIYIVVDLIKSGITYEKIHMFNLDCYVIN